MARLTVWLTLVTAAILGLDVVMVEKTQFVGGTSARSAGSVWVPNSRHAPPGSDDPDKALLYLRSALGNRFRESMVQAYLHQGPGMIEFLEDNSDVAFRPYAYHPDYLATLPGATLSGRVLEPVPFDAIVPTLIPLLEHFRRERWPGESFGDFCHRHGPERLQGWLGEEAAITPRPVVGRHAAAQPMPLAG